MNHLVKIDEKLNKIIEVILVILTIIMVVAMSSNIFLRYVMHRSPIWASELTTFLFVWIVFLGVSILSKREEHIAFEFIFNSRHKSVRTFAKISMRLVTLIIAYLFITQGYKLAVMSMEQVSLDMRFPMGIVYLVIPICGVLMGIHIVANFIRDYT